MKQLAILAVVLGLGLTFGAPNAEAAKRFGGARSSGMQRQLPPQQNTATPMQTPTSPAATTTTAKSGIVPAAAAPQKRSWMGPIAGLAAGLGLAALASHFGFGQELASMMMIALLVMAVMVVIGLVMRRRAGNQATSPGMRYAAAGAPQSAPQSARPFDMALPASSVLATASVAAGFDMEGFLRAAKVMFIRLQAANDTANLADIREFTTPEMFAEVRMEIAERGELEQRTDVLTVDAQLIEHVNEDEREIASVRFNATLREGGDDLVETIEEVWHLVLPKGRRSWNLAGIQQLQ